MSLGLLGKLARCITTVSTTALGYVNAHIYFEEHVTRWADKFRHEVLCADVDDF